MMLMSSISMAWRSLLANKLRAGLTMLGIIIGVGAVVALVGAGAGAEAQVTARFESLGSNLLVISPGAMFVGGISQGGASAASLTSDDVEAIKKLASTVAAVAPEYSAGRHQVVYYSANTQTTVQGVTPEYMTVNNWKVARGRFINSQDLTNMEKVAVLGATTAEDLFGELVNPIGKTIKINRQNYLVVGVLAQKGASGTSNQDDRVFIPLTTAQVKFGGAGNTSLSAINVQVSAADKMKSAKAELTAIMRARHGLTGSQSDDFTIRDQSQLVEMVAENAQTFTVLLSSIAAISLLVGGIGVMNIMLVSVTERTREIGIRKAVGAKRRNILTQFLVEAMVLCVLGGIVGVVAGYAGAQIVTPLLGGTRAVVKPQVVLLALAVSMGVGLFFGLYPANRAAMLHPIEALRYE